MSFHYSEKSIFIRAPIASVWNALTTPEQARLFFLGCAIISDWREGSAIHFDTEADGETRTIMKGEITEIALHQYLVYTCFTPEQEDHPAQHIVVSFRFSAVEGGTEIFVTQGPFSTEEQKQQYDDSGSTILDGMKVLVENQRAGF
ncbi:MAG: SRPBCC domain-containing protein [Gammaproteobacteria bacterium]|nr:SRPBCC domain-containing protein [Gammaproteobacteria bacterium]MDD9895460.1 SRPBCC domain-containing protein [Gammaproteobacteria bacterium]MDD9957523.1 SRPBCC domain-containing protein [Gammaproteobacteria bacterium]